MLPGILNSGCTFETPGRFLKLPLQTVTPGDSDSFCLGWGPGIDIFKKVPHMFTMCSLV